jgi:hypothetical protein
MRHDISCMPYHQGMAGHRFTLLLTTAAITFGATATAHAGVKKIKAELLCGTLDDDNNVQAPITGAGKTGKLPARIVCAMRMNDGKEPSHMGNIKTIRHTVTAAGKRKDVPGINVTNDFGAGSEHTTLDATMLGGKPDPDGAIAFVPCEDFDIVATISDDLGVYFTKKIKVVQGCPKPKPMKADVACRYLLKGDKSEKLKAGERPIPTELESLACTITSGDARFLDGFTGELALDWMGYNDDGSTKPVHNVERSIVAPGINGRPEMGFSTPAFTWPNCQDVDLTFKLGDAEATLFTKKIHTTITCGE